MNKQKNNKRIKSQKIYFIGIKGVGMTMLAQFLSSLGHEVSGSDTAETFLTDKVLHDAGIQVFSGFNTCNIPADVNTIVYSSAYNENNNPELGFIHYNHQDFKNIKILSYAEALGDIFNSKQGIAVCGSHGKTTTSAWLGYVLWKSNKQPNVLVGSRVTQFKGSSLVGKSKLFVAETDEYQNKLRFFNPYGVLLNNVDYDHPDFFKDEAAYTKVFRDFVKKIPKHGFLVFNYDDKQTKHVAKYSQAKNISYGIASENKKKAVEGLNYLARNIKTCRHYQEFEVNDLGKFKIALMGEHNIRNALAVIATALELKTPIALIKKNLASFKGTERRSQILGKYQEALFIDDYAHHPTEINTTIKALKASYPDKRLLVVFHPHTFTRTKALFKDFVSSFSNCDELIILDIYGSAREVQGGVTSAKLVRAISAFENRNKARINKMKINNISNMPAVAKYLKQSVNKNDLVVLMGAGDVFRVWDILNAKK